nr:hypothetical protein [uncultured Methanolobus sp.]
MVIALGCIGATKTLSHNPGALGLVSISGLMSLAVVGIVMRA